MTSSQPNGKRNGQTVNGQNHRNPLRRMTNQHAFVREIWK